MFSWCLHWVVITITKTCLYNVDPLKPHFYVVKLGFTGLYIIFLISAQKHRLWILGEAVLTSTQNLCFEQKCEKYLKFLSEIFHFLVVNFSVYLNRHVFVMLCGIRRSLFTPSLGVTDRLCSVSVWLSLDTVFTILVFFQLMRSELS